MIDLGKTPAECDRQQHVLEARPMGIETYQEPVVYMRADCPACRSEGFEAQSRVRINGNGRSLVATLNVVHGDLLDPGEAGLSQAAWALLGARHPCPITVAHPEPVESLGHVRAKLFGHTLGAHELEAIIEDIAGRRYTDVQLSAFLAACVGQRMCDEEVVTLTRAMVDAGERLDWAVSEVFDKHCVGGLPGNRTTPLVVAIATACGIIMPKTSSRAITSPAGTADAMATLTDVDLSLNAIRRVVEQEGGCIVWGGGVGLSPADEVLIRVEHALDLDSEAQLVASVLSKKIAAGSTYVVIDMPIGPTAKIRSQQSAVGLADRFRFVGAALGIAVEVVVTDGSQPVGRGIGPALEARDVLAVLRGEPDAPSDLRERGVQLAGAVLERSGRAPPGGGAAMALAVLRDGRAWRKFEAICEAQGGMRVPPVAAHRHVAVAGRSGRVAGIDNRLLAKVAKLAGAPSDAAAGVELHAHLGDHVDKGTPVITVHAESPGELAYALGYLAEHRDLVRIDDLDRAAEQ